MDDDSIVIDRKHNGDPHALGAKNDSILQTLPSQNNAYSEAVTVKAVGGFHGGFLVCKACKNTFECSEAATPLFVTDLPTKNGKKCIPSISLFLLF